MLSWRSSRGFLAAGAVGAATGGALLLAQMLHKAETGTQ
ncbi:hypothetical protein SNL152K_5783 [Streptomyces sp. NL15-2K]|nr:hypothetical protein SNL152K_5783 [Streptomyces sp. NL15-2K]